MSLSVPHKRQLELPETHVQSSKRPKDVTSKRGFVEYHPQTHDVASSQRQSSDGPVPGNGPSRKQVSCCECRRLKLKCDRNFPCQACVKRGCQDICPDGSLVSGKGSRYVLASTEKLHEKISVLVERVRELENALELLHEAHWNCSEVDKSSCVPITTHPLLTKEKLYIKITMDLYSEGQLDRTSLPQIKNSAESQSRTTPPKGALEPSNSRRSTVVLEQAATGRDLDFVIRKSLPALEPLFLFAFGRNPGVRLEIGAHEISVLRSDLYHTIATGLPPRYEAEPLVSFLKVNGSFLINYMLTPHDFDSILQSCYSQPDLRKSNLYLAFIFIILAMSIQLGRPEVQCGDEMKLAKRYYTLSRVSLTKFVYDSVSNGSPTHEDLLSATKCLCLLVAYLEIFTWQKEDETEASLLVSHLLMAMEKLDLHSEKSYTRYSPCEQNERRLVCYTVMMLLGKFMFTSTTSELRSQIPVITTLPPSCSYDAERFPSPVEASYHQIRNEFYKSCCPRVLQNLRSKSIRYEDALQIDSKIRDFPFNDDFTLDFTASNETEIITDNPSKPLRVEVLRFLSIQCVHNTLLFLHRPYFQICLGKQANVLADPHLPSVFATMRSACILIREFEAMEKAYPSLMSKITYSWYQIFCAASALFTLIERIPYCPLSPYTQRELSRAAELFSRSSSPFARQLLPIVQHYTFRSFERLRKWKEILKDEAEADLLRDRLRYTHQRFKAIMERAETAREARSRPNTQSPVASVSSLRVQNPKFDADVYVGLEAWDLAHVDILDIFLSIPTAIMSSDDEGETCNSILSTMLNRNDGSSIHGAGSRIVLSEIFEKLDESLTRRTATERIAYSTPVSGGSGSAGPPADKQAYQDQDFVVDTLDIDWAVLNDVLMADPEQILKSMGLSGDWNFDATMTH